MRKALALILGIFTGIASSLAFIIWRSDVDFSELPEQFHAHVEDAVEAGRKASAERKQELEAELAEMSSRE